MDGIDTNVSGLRAVSTAAAQTTRVAAVEQATPVKASDTVETANLISLLANAAPPVDSKKVDAIRSLIASGAYPIDEHAIASKMIALDVAA